MYWIPPFLSRIIKHSRCSKIPAWGLCSLVIFFDHWRALVYNSRQFILVFISFPEVIFSRLFITFHIHFLKFRKKDVNDGYSCNCHKGRKSFKSGRSAKWLFWNGTCAYPIYNTFYEELQVYKDILPSKGQFYMRSILQSIFCFYSLGS